MSLEGGEKISVNNCFRDIFGPGMYYGACPRDPLDPPKSTWKVIIDYHSIFTIIGLGYEYVPKP